MIGRIHERRHIERLSRDGRRASTASLWCRFLDDPATVPPRVAFAIGRPVGSAVVRNRLRRRLRALLRAAAATGALPPGWMLVGARPVAAERSFDELGAEMTSLLHALARTGR